jgi:23S rRNA (guanosine2251-2'-O)-methyltransferase
MADRDGPRDRRDFDPQRPRRGGFDRPRREFDRGPGGGPRRSFEGPGRGGSGARPAFERPRRDSDGPRRQFDGPRRDFDRPRRDFARPGPGFNRPGPGFDRPRRDFDRPSDEDRPDQAGGAEAGVDRPFARPRGSGFGRPPERRGPGRPPTRPPYRGGPPRPAGPARSDFLGEGEELIAGRRPVGEAFAARRQARRLIVVPERRAALESLVLHATTLRLPVVEVEGGTLTSLTGFDGHQGIALVVAARPPASVDDIVARARARDEQPFVLVLDSLEDPQNLGTLLRSAEACGVHGVVYPTRHAAPLTAAAVKSSAGATEHLLLAAVDNLPGTLADLRAAGFRLVGADEGAGLRYSEADFRGPLALVVGSEERGISGALRRRLDMTVRIPMRGRVASLNAAVAGSVLLFAAADQRGAPETGDRPPFDDPPPAAEVDEPVADSEVATEPASQTATEPASEKAPEGATPEPADEGALLPDDATSTGDGEEGEQEA